MNFFCKKKHYDQWTSEMGVPNDQIFCLEAQEAIWVSRMLFGLEGDE